MLYELEIRSIADIAKEMILFIHLGTHKRSIIDYSFFLSFIYSFFRNDLD